LMHLDTWLTMLDHNKFLYSTNMMKSIKFWKIALNTKTVKVEQYKNVTLEQLLESIIHEKPILIPVADNYSKIEVDVETTFDGTNFLVIKPGVVVGYSRNEHTIKALRKAGIKVYAFDGDQLSLGMGSARCMSMPLVRKPITSSY
jgi:arginine deiminase